MEEVKVGRAEEKTGGWTEAGGKAEDSTARAQSPYSSTQHHALNLDDQKCHWRKAQA